MQIKIYTYEVQNPILVYLEMYFISVVVLLPNPYFYHARVYYVFTQMTKTQFNKTVF